MSENKYTPEPWQVFEDDPRAIVTKGNPMLSLLSVGEDGLAIMYEEADARRIVACVNACAGISTENLEDNLPVKELARRYNKALRQRDELLAALEFYAERHHFILHDANAWETVSGEPQNFQEDEANTATVEDGSVAKAAISRVKGEQ